MLELALFADLPDAKVRQHRCCFFAILDAVKLVAVMGNCGHENIAAHKSVAPVSCCDCAFCISGIHQEVLCDTHTHTSVVLAQMSRWLYACDMRSLCMLGHTPLAL